MWGSPGFLDVIEAFFDVNFYSNSIFYVDRRVFLCR